MELFGNVSHPVSITSSGNNTVITPGEGRGIYLRKMVLQANSLATITFKAGTTALSGPMSFGSGGSLIVDGAPFDDKIWDLGVGNAFVINLATGLIINVGGWIVYEEYLIE